MLTAVRRRRRHTSHTPFTFYVSQNVFETSRGASRRRPGGNTSPAPVPFRRLLFELRPDTARWIREKVVRNVYNIDREKTTPSCTFRAGSMWSRVRRSKHIYYTPSAIGTCADVWFSVNVRSIVYAGGPSCGLYAAYAPRPNTMTARGPDGRKISFYFVINYSLLLDWASSWDRTENNERNAKLFDKSLLFFFLSSATIFELLYFIDNIFWYEYGNRDVFRCDSALFSLHPVRIEDYFEICDFILIWKSTSIA